MLSHRASPRKVAAISNLLLLVSLALSPLPLSAKSHPAAAPSLDPSYIYALAAADHFLQAWQSGDSEQGLVLLTSHAKQTSDPDAVEKFFSSSENSAYEIDRGKLLKRGRYEFPVVLVSGTSAKARARRRFSSIVVVNSGRNDWAVDKLP